MKLPRNVLLGLCSPRSKQNPPLTQASDGEVCTPAAGHGRNRTFALDCCRAQGPLGIYEGLWSNVECRIRLSDYTLLYFL